MAELPHVFISARASEDDTARELAGSLREVGVSSPLVLTSIHGRRLAEEIGGSVEVPPAGADQGWAADLGARAHDSGANAIVAVGGGRTLDVGKLAAARAGLAMVAVPTQLSHDGICSPVAVVPGRDGRTQSLGAVAPRAVFVPLATVADAPPASVAAGIGDLLANPLALKDWRLAADRGLEQIDARAWDLSVQSYELIRPRLDRGAADWVGDRDALSALADALVLSGLAMIASGTSRPASGGEHEISHGIDHLLGGRAMHGAQVAFGSIITTALYEEDVASLRRILRGLGLPDHPSHLGMDTDTLVTILAEAPNTRPGRFTILEERNLDRIELERLVLSIWS